MVVVVLLLLLLLLYAKEPLALPLNVKNVCLHVGTVMKPQDAFGINFKRLLIRDANPQGVGEIPKFI